jgi:chromosome partitioning protein
MAVVARYNSKGGVGKTTSCVNLAWSAASTGKRVLLWDLDPQGAASFYLRRDRGLGHKAKKLFSGKANWQDEIIGSPYLDLSLIPADHSLGDFDILLNEERKAKKVLADWIKPLRDQYDVIFLDCPAGLTLVSENVFRAADFVIVPVVPTPLSIRTFHQMITFFDDKEDLIKIRPFLSMCDFRKNVHKKAAETLLETPGTFKTVLPLMAEIEKMGVTLVPSVVGAASRSRPFYIALWEEIAQELTKI